MSLFLLLTLLLTPDDSHSAKGAKVSKKALGALVRVSSFSKEKLKSSGVEPHSQITIPVNILRLYSDKHSAEQVMSKSKIQAQLFITNQIFRYNQVDMRTFNVKKRAPILQFSLHKIYDVHEKDASKLLGFTVNTEGILMSGRFLNGQRTASTWDLRSIKIKGETHLMTMYYAWSGRSEHRTGGWAGVSNLGIAEKQLKYYKNLQKVTGARSKMGVVLFPNAKLSTMAHEVGHFFNLPHAWHSRDYGKRGITDIGTGPKGNVDNLKDMDNIMDYHRDDTVYFTKSQLKYMYGYASQYGSTLLQLKGHSKHLAKVGKSVSLGSRASHLEASFAKVWLKPIKKGGDVHVFSRFSVKNMSGLQGKVRAWFQDEHGRNLKDKDKRYASVSGAVSINKTFHANSPLESFEKFHLRLPGEQLHLKPGKHKLRVIVALFQGGTWWAHSNPVYFTYNAAKKKPKKAVKKKVKIKTVWIEHNVKKKGKTGFYVRARLWISGYKKKKIRFMAFFMDQRGRFLLDQNGKYCSKDGYVTSAKYIRPSYHKSSFPGIHLFIPYKELHLSKGIHPLTVTVMAFRNDAQVATSRRPTSFFVRTR